jgi:hypothetical protein
VYIDGSCELERAGAAVSQASLRGAYDCCSLAILTHTLALASTSNGTAGLDWIELD